MSKYVTKTLGAVVAVVLAVVLAFTLATSGANQASAGDPDCIIDVSGVVGLVICDDKVVDQLPLPQVTVKGPTITLPPIKVPGQTVNVPGPVRTVTVGPEQETVTVPGPTETVPGPTETVTVTVTAPNETVTANSPRPRQPNVTKTTTPTSSPTRQPDQSSGRVDPAPKEDTPSVDLGDGKTTVAEVGIGLASVFGVLLVVFFAMYLGWRIGRRGSRDEDTAFMRSLLNNAKTR